MLRSLTLAAAVLAAMIPGNVSAQDVNLHNGYIVVRNETVITNYRKVVTDAATVALRFDGTTRESAVVNSSGGTVYLNNCCILAGTLYEVKINVMGKSIHAMVRPQLCNVRGIPHGFALVTFTGTAERDSNNNWVVHVEPHVPSVPCP